MEHIGLVEAIASLRLGAERGGCDVAMTEYEDIQFPFENYLKVNNDNPKPFF